MIIEVRPSGRAITWLGVLLLGIPMIILIAALWFAKAQSAMSLFSNPIVLVSIGISAFLFFAMSLAMKGSVEIADGHLFVNAVMKKEKIDRANLSFGEAVEIADGSEHTPVIRIWGVGLPGFKAGTFRLRNRKTALVLIASDAQTYIPVAGGTGLVLDSSVVRELIDVSL